MARYEVQMIIRCQTMIEVEAESEHVAKMLAAHETLVRMKDGQTRIIALPFECVKIERKRKK